MKIGELDISSLHDVSVQVDPGLLFSGRTPDRQYLEDDGQIRLDFGGFLVRSGDRCVLVDLGFGPASEIPESGKMLDNLARLGMSAADVTDVVMTHLHFDHVGWASRDGEVTFPNATYRCDEKDWDFFMGPNAAFEGHGHGDTSPIKIKEVLKPVANHIEMWDSDRTVAPGVDVRRTPGHTPGSSIVVISDGIDRAMLLGDICHCPAELLEDDWDMMADVNPEMARRARESLARELEGTNTHIAAAHFPGLRFGRLLKTESNRNWIFDMPQN
jgi:glyoxylase-like metal-dependent hydrolase (beta-lactamase superfamily II)